MNKTWAYFWVGIVSALLSTLSIIDYSRLGDSGFELVDFESTQYYAPGLIFSLCISVYLVMSRRSTHSGMSFFGRSIIWIPLSVAAYGAAVWTVISSFPWILMFSGFGAGLVGGIIVCLGYKFTIANNRKNLTPGQFFKTISLSAVIGLIWFLLLMVSDGVDSIWPILILFLVWQSIILACLGAADKDPEIQVIVPPPLSPITSS